MTGKHRRQARSGSSSGAEGMIRLERWAQRSQTAPMPPDTVVFAEINRRVVDAVNLCRNSTFPSSPMVPVPPSRAIRWRCRAASRSTLDHMTGFVAVHSRGSSIAWSNRACATASSSTNICATRACSSRSDPGADATRSAAWRWRRAPPAPTRCGTGRCVRQCLGAHRRRRRTVATISDVAPRATSPRPAMTSPACSSAPEGTAWRHLTEVTLRLHGYSAGDIGRVSCPFPDGRRRPVDAAVATIQLGHPGWRASELLDDIAGPRRSTAWSKMDAARSSPPLFLRIPRRRRAGVAQAVGTRQEARLRRRSGRRPVSPGQTNTEERSRTLAKPATTPYWAGSRPAPRAR